MTEIINGIPQPVDTSKIYVKATYFETVGSGVTSGIITKPAGNNPEVEFIMNDWGADTDGLVSTMSNGKPTFKSPVDSGGNNITTTLNISGEYVLSGTPSPAGDHAIVYVYKCYLKNFNVDEALFESESIDFEATGSIATHAAIAATASIQGHATAVQITKLDGIEALADITDAINIASSIVGVADKSAIIDADLIALIDSEAANVLKKITWTQIKAFLKTYFDTLYNKYVHPNHSGEVTSVADGVQTIATAAVTLAKMADMATASLLGRNTAGTGVPEVLAKATALSLLNVADGADVTSSNETSHADVLVDGDIGVTVMAYGAAISLDEVLTWSTL